MAQKVIEGGIVTWRYMHEILRWLNFKLAQNLRSRVKTPRWLTFSDQKLWDSSKFEQKLDSRYWLLRILSHLRVSGLKKWAISEFWHVIVDFEPIWSWAISKSHAYAFTWQHLLRWLFEPSQGLPRMWSLDTLVTRIGCTADDQSRISGRPDSAVIYSFAVKVIFQKTVSQKLETSLII